MKMSNQNIQSLSILFSIPCIILIIISIIGLLFGSSVQMFTLLLVSSFALSIGFVYWGKKNFSNEGISSVRLGNHYFFYYKILLLIFFASLLLLCFILYKSIYIKPIEYYLLLSVCSVSIAIQIYYIKNNKSILFILFFEIVPLSFISLGSSYFINPHLIGPDAYWHFNQVTSLVSKGHLLPESYHYYHYPLYHILQSFGQIVLGPSEIAYNLINIFTIIVLGPLSYIVSKKIFFNEKAGLFSAMLVVLSSSSIFTMTNASKIGGLIILLLCLYILIRSIEKIETKWTLLFWACAITVLFWHLETSIILWFIITAVFSSKVLSKIIGRNNSSYNHVQLLLFSIIFISYLAFSFNSLFIDLVQTLFLDVSITGSSIQNETFYTIGFRVIFELIFAYLSIGIILFFIPFIIIKNSTKFNMSYAVVILFIISLGIFSIIGLFSGSFASSPSRNLTYFVIVATIVAGGGMTYLFVNNYKSNNKIITILLLSTILIVLTFSSAISYLNWDNNVILNEDIPVQVVYTTEYNLITHHFLDKTPRQANINGYYETIRYTTDSNRGIFSLPDRNISSWPSIPDNAFLVIEGTSYRMTNIDDSSLGIVIEEKLHSGEVLYTNKFVIIYYI